MKQEAGNLLQQDHDCMLIDVTNIYENIYKNKHKREHISRIRICTGGGGLGRDDFDLFLKFIKPRSLLFACYAN